MNIPINNCFLCTGEGFMYKRCDDYVRPYAYTACIYKQIANKDVENIKKGDKEKVIMKGALEEYLEYMEEFDEEW